MQTLTYTAGDELPHWSPTYVLDGADVDMSSGWTFQVTVAPVGSTTASFTKTTNITGTTTGCTVSWATSGELSTLAVGRYTARCRAQRTSDSHQATATILIVIEPTAT